MHDLLAADRKAWGWWDLASSPSVSYVVSLRERKTHCLVAIELSAAKLKHSLLKTLYDWTSHSVAFNIEALDFLGHLLALFLLVLLLLFFFFWVVQGAHI